MSYGKIGIRVIPKYPKMELSPEEKQQYNRHIILENVGLEGQLKLKQAKVLVIGAGGLGCPVLQYLSAAGIGRIGIVDDDVVDETNLQRQVLFTHEDIGKSKAEVAAKRLQALNPYITFDVYADRVSRENVLELLKQYDVIVDGTDNFPTRYLISDAAVLQKKPVVFGSIFKFDGQVSVFNYENGPTYRCLFPTPPLPDAVPNCSEIGVLGILPGIIGSLQATEVVKMVLGLGDVLAGKLLTFDALSMRQMIVSFEKDDTINITGLADDYLAFCGLNTTPDEISLSEYRQDSHKYNLLDVRTYEERNAIHIGGAHIPLDELPNRLSELLTNKPIVVYCKAGMRSQAAIQFLKGHGFDQLINLIGGIGE